MKPISESVVVARLRRWHAARDERFIVSRREYPPDVYRYSILDERTNCQLWTSDNLATFADEVLRPGEVLV